MIWNLVHLTRFDSFRVPSPALCQLALSYLSTSRLIPSLERLLLRRPPAAAVTPTAHLHTFHFRSRLIMRPPTVIKKSYISHRGLQQSSSEYGSWSLVVPETPTHSHGDVDRTIFSDRLPRPSTDYGLRSSLAVQRTPHTNSSVLSSPSSLQLHIFVDISSHTSPAPSSAEICPSLGMGLQVYLTRIAISQRKDAASVNCTERR